MRPTHHKIALVERDTARADRAVKMKQQIAKLMSEHGWTFEEISERHRRTIKASNGQVDMTLHCVGIWPYSVLSQLIKDANKVGKWAKQVRCEVDIYANTNVSKFKWLFSQNRVRVILKYLSQGHGYKKYIVKIKPKGLKHYRMKHKNFIQYNDDKWDVIKTVIDKSFAEGADLAYDIHDFSRPKISHSLGYSRWNGSIVEASVVKALSMKEDGFFTDPSNPDRDDVWLIIRTRAYAHVSPTIGMIAYNSKNWIPVCGDKHICVNQDKSEELGQLTLVDKEILDDAVGKWMDKCLT